MPIPASRKLKILNRVLKEGKTVAEVCRKAKIARKTYYSWKKRYLGTPNRIKKRALEPQYPSGKAHSRNKRVQFKTKVIGIIVAHPSWGSQKISAKLGKIGMSLSNHAVYNLLKDLHLETQEKREEFSSLYQTFAKIEKVYQPQPLRLLPEVRKRMIEEVVIGGETVAHVCQKYYLSRKTYYKWLARYQKAKEKKAVLLPAMEDDYVRGLAHPRSLSEKTQERILVLVRQHPEYSTHKVAQTLAKVGNHGVQNVFQRLKLNTFEKRMAYAQTYLPETLPAGGDILDRLKPIFGKIPAISVLPPPTKRRIASLSSPFLASFFSTVLFSLLFIYWLGIFSQLPTLSAKIGLLFASVALLTGTFFFVYSMKYYLTLAIVLSFSRQPIEEGGFSVGLNGKLNGNHNGKNGNGGWFRKIFGLENGNGNGNGNGKNGRVIQAGGLQPSLDHVKLKRYPFVSIHLPFYNEKKVVERILSACTAMDYPHYEVIVCDDSNDETINIVNRFAKKHNKEHSHGPKIKVLHRSIREGFKGGALSYAVKEMDPRTEFCVVFDADFIPYPDTLEMFVKYFKVNNNSSENYQRNNIAVVGGYQWHVLNKSENWITRGVRTEYAGSYVIERPGTEILGLLKQISGSVYMIRADVLKKIGWGTSITEDFQLTLRLYAQGYKVVYTPYVQAPSECVSTLKRLIRQRMRWSEGHSHCIKQMFLKLMTSSKLTLLEKLEVLYLSPYYLQAAFFLIGTFCWLMAETVFRARLPFWASLWGWSLVLTNFFALPLVNAVGMFLEESEEKDYLGILSFVALSYIVVPFQAYASVKGFIEKQEGPWFRTPKTGLITDIFTRGKFYRWIAGILPGGRSALAASLRVPRVTSAYIQNPYLARATANNQFNSFRLETKKNYFIGELAIFLVVGLSSVFSYFGNRVPQGAIVDLPIEARIEVSQGNYSLATQLASFLKPKAVLASSNFMETFFAGKTSGVVDGGFIFCTSLSFVFLLYLLRRKRGLLKKVIRPLFLTTLILTWLLASWPPLWQSPRFPPEIQKARATYDDVVLGTNGGPSYRLKLDGDLVEDIVGITVTGAPNSYVSTIIPLDSGQCGEYSAAQETVLANQTNVNSATTYRKAVSFWVIIDTFGTGDGANSRLIWEEGGATNWWSAYTSNGDELRISIGESSGDVGHCVVAGLSTGSVYHVVMQWDGATENMELWVNGVEECSTTTSTAAALSSHTGDWEIAGASDAKDHTSVAIGQQFDGKIADYSYWAEPTRLLTEAEIVAIYEAGYNLPPSPTLYIPFNNEKTGDSTPDFEFVADDPDGTADITYQIQVSTDYTFVATPLIDCASDTSCTTGAGSFTNTVTPADTDPFNDNERIRFTPTTTMTTGTTYYWKVRAKGDVVTGGAGIYGDWSNIRSLTYVSGTSPSQWFQTTDEQLDTGTLVKTESTGSDSVGISTIAYPYIRTQAGELVFGTTDSSLPQDLNNAVLSQSNAFILVWGTGVDQDIERVKFRARFNSNSQIEVFRGESGTAAKAYWQVIEADNFAATPAFTVQTNDISIASGSTTGNAGITDVGSISSTTTIVQASCGSSDDTTQVQFQGYLSSTTQVDVARTTSGSACTVRYWVIKWRSGINVYNGYTANTTSPTNASIGGTVDLSRSVLFMSWDNSVNGLSQHATRGYLSSTTQVTFSRTSDGGTNNVRWSVVEFPSGVVVRADNGTSSPTLGTTGTTVDQAISSVTQANSFTVHSVQVSGTGSAIVRGETIAYLTSPTNIRFEKLYTAQTSIWSYYVADFTGWTFTVSSGTVMSSTIDNDWFPPGSPWNQVVWSKSGAGILSIQVYYKVSTACDTIVPDVALSGNSSGFTTSPIDITGLSTSTYNELCIKATLTDSGGTSYLEEWGVSVPEQLLLFLGGMPFLPGFIKKIKGKRKK